jgi:hypothetical protein
MEDRRKIKRRFLLYYVRVYDSKKSEQIGHLVDITPHGAMVIAENPLPVGQNFNLRIELTSEISDRQYMEIIARSIWCQPDIDPHFHNTGFEIVQIEPRDAAIIQRIVEEYGFRDNQGPPPKND